MNRHWGAGTVGTLRIARIVRRSTVLGPGLRTLLVVQGCELRCRSCTAPHTHRLDGGRTVLVADLIRELCVDEAVTGVTFTGGEPFLQAGALVELVDGLRQRRPDLSTMSYSGYRVEWLRVKGSPDQGRLLARLDLLVDGPYVERRHASLLWRGSRNQRIHALTPRHRAELRRLDDTSAGMEWSLDRDLNLGWVGIPPTRGFADNLATLAAPAETPKGHTT